MSRAKRDKETADKIYRAIANGNTHRASCALSGVSHTFFYEWIKDDADFADTVKKAEAEAEAFHVDRIKLHSFRNWQASAWMLERRNPEEWGKKDKVDVTSNGEKIGFLSWSDESKE